MHHTLKEYLFDKLIHMTERKPSDEEIRELAQQLRKPEGEMGLKVAEKMNEANRYINEDTLKYLDLSQGHRVLEIGMGNGHFVPRLLDLARDLHYTGLDYSVDMVDLATDLNREHVSSGQARFLHGSIDMLPFEDNGFDNIFTVNTIYFWPSTEAGFEEITRVLKSGGQLIIAIRPASYMKHYPIAKYNFRMFEGKEVARLMEAFGMTDIQVIFRKEPEQEVYGKSDRRESCLIIGKAT